MRITYYALRSLQVGDSIRQPGDLVPEAAGWAYLSGYVQDGKLAPVLVVTLPQDVQDMLLEWEMEQEEAATADAPADETQNEPLDEAPKDEPAKPADKAKPKEKVA